MSAGSRHFLSVVVPVLNERESVRPLGDEIARPGAPA